jgi:urease subunit beta
MTRNDHPSDDPGRDKRTDRYGSQRHPSSGPGAPSQPRRPGTGERQAPRRQEPHDIPAEHPLVPGEILYAADPVVINAGMEVVTLRVTNTADRPVQVGSHYHFAEVNPGLDFDRKAAWGRRLNVLSGGSVRFEPGAVEEVELIPIAGQRIVAGLRGECGGNLDG